jgi:ring-1,2-phenylacetyl-CoA epoxidase subunit PaaC
MQQLVIAPDLTQLHLTWKQHIQQTCVAATLRIPADEAWMQRGGKTGVHTEHLGYILAEMQFLQRAYPGAQW